LPMTGGETPTVSVEQAANSAVPFRRLSRIGGDFLGWNADLKGVYYSLGRAFFQYDLARADSLATDAAAKAPPGPPAAGAARAAAADHRSANVARRKADLRADAHGHHHHGREGSSDRD